MSFIVPSPDSELIEFTDGVDRLDVEKVATCGLLPAFKAKRLDPFSDNWL
jgi:hypothetical protein